MTTTSPRPLRVGLIAPPWFPVPPTGYGGIELVVSLLAEGLVARGHDVTLFAAGGSQTTARLVTSFCEAPSLLIGNTMVEAEHLVDAYAHWPEFDIIHDHTLTGLIAGANLPIPVVHTIHGPIYERFAALYARVASRVSLIAISEHQRSTLPEGADATVIHNAVDTTAFPFSPEPGEYLLWVGRISPEKGILPAIEIARRAELPLKIIAKINEEPERQYFKTHVEPALRSLKDVDISEQPPLHEKLAAYRGALATLFPIEWPEPFGLVMIESMATGTPVIAFRNGAAPEVIVDGVTGFICENIDAAVEAVHRVRELDRRNCRSHVAERFDVGINVARHEALYGSLVAARPELVDIRPMLAPAPGLSTAAGQARALL